MHSRRRWRNWSTGPLPSSHHPRVHQVPGTPPRSMENRRTNVRSGIGNGSLAFREEEAGKVGLVGARRMMTTRGLKIFGGKVGESSSLLNLFEY
jgi:hypothetical protein